MHTPDLLYVEVVAQYSVLFVVAEMHLCIQPTNYKTSSHSPGPNNGNFAQSCDMVVSTE
jgi:hypothetical protein